MSKTRKQEKNSKRKYYRDLEVSLLWEHYLDWNDRFTESMECILNSFDTSKLDKKERKEYLLYLKGIYEELWKDSRELRVIYKIIRKKPHEEKKQFIFSLIDNAEELEEVLSGEGWKYNEIDYKDYIDLKNEIKYFAHEFGFPGYVDFH